MSRFSGSWNVLLPIVYFIYYNPDYKDNEEGVRAYLVRAILFTYFQSGTTSKLQQMKSNINENDYEITIDMLNQMNELRVTDARLRTFSILKKVAVLLGKLFIISVLIG